MSSTTDRFIDAVFDFESAVHAQDSQAQQQAHSELHRCYRSATPQELAQGGKRLAELLPDVPTGPRANIAVLIGACVEGGADPVACAPGVLANLAITLGGAKEFAEKWTAAADGVDVPDPEQFELDPDLFEVFGFDQTLAWWTLDLWSRAGLAMLQHREVRQKFGQSGREIIRERHDALGEISDRWDKCLGYALIVLDDEPFVVLHRETGTGYAMRMTGIGDNFQLHTLVADALIGGGHIPGAAPAAEAVAMCRDMPGMVHTTGSFNLVAPDGSWIWNEGTPSDIPVVDGTRLLVLDPPPYQRTWPAGRFFPHMVGDLTLERVLTADETAAWFQHVSPAKDSNED
ncbi:hypothetical protein [Nocardia pseudovaccinii]|uniref:hypothetical protein n=1 Tax=Nocardia pseudovaccinii TaxID=189540 RepID=UPI0007A3CBDC|nr:hypothetical protein [Nocardia pseudovaccinii]